MLSPPPPPSATQQPDPISSSTTPSYDPVGIFWDYENCAPSTNASGYNIVENIRTLASQFGSVNIFKAYLQLPEKSSPRQTTLRSELQSCGLSLTDCPHNGKNSVDLMMIVDIMAFIKDNPPPATVILISGDRDFAYLLSTVRWRKYNVVLISNSFMTHESLTVQASIVYDWKSDILKTRPPPKPPTPGSQTLSSIASLTTPQESNNLPESDVHVVDSPNERVAPAVQPSTPPPRPASTVANTVAVNTTRPRSATLPSNASSVDSEAMGLPPKAGTHAKTASAGIPSNPISDDWVEADLTGGSTMDPTSPGATDPIDDGGVYSPAFSSPEMNPSKGEDNVPSSPGRLLLIDEESLVEPTAHNLGVVDPSGTIKPILRACECKICAKSPVLSESKTPTLGIVDCHQVESVPCGPSGSPPTIAPPMEPSQSEAAKPSLEIDTEHKFEDLKVVLSELLAKGGPTPRLSTVFSLWKDRKLDTFETVGLSQFKAYLQLVESAGLITVEQRQDGDEWVILRHQHSDSPTQQVGSRFRELIRALSDLRLAGYPEPQAFVVSPRLLRNNPSVYKDAGVTTFEEYLRAATEAGVVTARGGKNSDGLLKLCPAYYNPPACPPTPTGTTSTPPTRTDTTPFSPLVEFLKAKQSTSSQPISFSVVFSHLVSTLGYPGLVSLCCSVPGVTAFGQYIDAAIDSGLISLVGGTTASRNALLSLRVRLPDSTSPPAQPTVSTTPLPSRSPPQEITVPLPSVKVTANSFHDLVAVLKGLRALTGKPMINFARVTPLLLGRRPDAFVSVGVTEFRDYLTLAVKHGVVKAWAVEQSDGWVALSDPEPAGPAGPAQFSKPSEGAPPPPSVNPKEGVVDPKFVDLVKTLGELWRKGDKRPLLSHVGSELMKISGSRARTLNACGVINFRAYAMLAKDARIVEIHELPGKLATVSLDPTIRVMAGYT